MTIAIDSTRPPSTDCTKVRRTFAILAVPRLFACARRPFTLPGA